VDCFYCGSDLPPPDPEAPGRHSRVAYDPEKGRLWAVCPTCLRWNPVPLEARWEVLESCERTVQDRGKIRLASDHLALVTAGEGELVRVGAPPRVEMAGWRYGDRLPMPGLAGRPLRRLLSSLFSRLPEPPVGGYNPYHSREAALPPPEWIGSAFLQFATPLTFAFTQVPFARRCPACGKIMPLEPWAFSSVTFVSSSVGQVAARCGSCGESVVLPLLEARAAIRFGLALVTRPGEIRSQAEGGASILEEQGGPLGLIRTFAGQGQTLGSLPVNARTGLIIGLDELAELEALELEWREAEEIAAIMDDELTLVPGFEEFRRRVLDQP
jgi:hypothetical protein